MLAAIFSFRPDRRAISIARSSRFSGDDAAQEGEILPGLLAKRVHVYGESRGGSVACQLAPGIGRRWSSEIETSGTSGYSSNRGLQIRKVEHPVQRCHARTGDAATAESAGSRRGNG